MIPTLDWQGGLLGVRLRLEPKNITELYESFITTFNDAKKLQPAPKNKNTSKNNFQLWPKNILDFLDKELQRYFTLNKYLLDPSKADMFQTLSDYNLPIENDGLESLIKIDIINAQRGSSNPNSDDTDTNSDSKWLSNQLRSYYDKHLNPTEAPTTDDISALSAIHVAKEIFDEDLKRSFKPSLEELEGLNYPGFGNPKINLSSKFMPVESLNHDSAILYSLGDDDLLSLPEHRNGLGYRNLISIIFKLIRFRDEWMQVGKKKVAGTPNEFHPLHIVLVEEPEAHLHAQVQQVFIKKAYDVLRKLPKGINPDIFTTQLIISTHSSHIAHEADFTSLRYFKRNIPKTGSIATSTVVSLSKTFGAKNGETTKFAERYLRTTHCDLFFADATILVEGPVERMLIPYFIKNNHSKLNTCYISILEIGGSHAHRLKPLIEDLGLITLIVTDLDSVKDKSKVQPEIGKKYQTGNDTLKKWIPKITDLDQILTLDNSKKEDSTHLIRVAFQSEVKINITKDETHSVYPYTFEDSLVIENKGLFSKLDGIGLMKKMSDAAKEQKVDKSAKMMYDAINAKSVKKAEFALELLYLKEPDDLKTPNYIKEGLDWLEKKLAINKEGLTTKTQTNG